jgi:hypothetical protein
LVLVALLWSADALLDVFGRTYPLTEWLIPRYARAWLWAFVFVISSLSVGNLLVTVLSAPGERSDGQLTLGFATGVYVFFLAVFVAGVAGWLNQVAFFAIPALLFAVGAPALFRTAKDFLRRRRRWPALGVPAHADPGKCRLRRALVPPAARRAVRGRGSDPPPSGGMERGVHTPPFFHPVHVGLPGAPSGPVR